LAFYVPLSPPRFSLIFWCQKITKLCFWFEIFCAKILAKNVDEIDLRASHGFGRGKLGHLGLVLGWSLFLQLPSYLKK
jgi:hypothetical protein